MTRLARVAFLLLAFSPAMLSALIPSRRPCCRR